MDPREALLTDATARAGRYLAALEKTAVGPSDANAALLKSFTEPFPDNPADAAAVLAQLDEVGRFTTVANAGGRFFGFVCGGTVPAAMAASVLVSVWDQNAGLNIMSPLAAELEQISVDWVVSALGLPLGTGAGVVTGATMANFTALAAAIVAGAEERKFQLFAAEAFESVTGKGVKARIDGALVALGNQKLMQDAGVQVEPLLKGAEALRADGQTVMFVAVDGKAAGLIGVADPIKETTAEAIRQLHEDKIRVVMLTGDSRTTAEAVARKLGIDEIIAEVLPEDKSKKVKQLQEQGHFVAMAGDGINDAPALAQAQVGIAMGTGTDVAMQSAGITLVKGDLRGIVRARLLSRATMSNIKENLFFAFIYNALGIPIAAGVLYPFFGLLLSPMIAAAAMSFSSVSVILNALRLRSVRL